MEKIYREYHDHITIRVSNKLNFPPHFHNEIETIFVLKGTVTAYCDGQGYALKSGDVFICAANQIHSYRNSSPVFDSVLLIMAPELLWGKTALLSENAPSFPVYSDPQKESLIWEIIENMIKQHKDMDIESTRLLVSGVLSIVLNNMELRKPALTEHNIQAMVAYCRQHFKESISIQSIQTELFLSRSYISHSFSNILKISFPDYINQLRLNEAVRFLKFSKMTVTEIAMQSGFPTIRNFNRVFLKHYGISPSQFRKEIKNNDLA